MQLRPHNLLAISAAIFKLILLISDDSFRLLLTPWMDCNEFSLNIGLARRDTLI